MLLGQNMSGTFLGTPKLTPHPEIREKIMITENLIRTFFLLRYTTVKFQIFFHTCYKVFVTKEKESSAIKVLHIIRYLCKVVYTD